MRTHFCNFDKPSSFLKVGKNTKFPRTVNAQIVLFNV